MSVTLRFLVEGNRLRRAYARRCDRVAEQFSLKRIELDVLVFLKNNAPLDTARDIAELRGLAKSNLSTAVESLTAGGYLEQRPDPADRRKVHLVLTDAALPVVEQAGRMQEEFGASLLRGVSPEDLAALERVGQCIRENLKQEEGRELGV